MQPSTLGGGVRLSPPCKTRFVRAQHGRNDDISAGFSFGHRLVPECGCRNPFSTAFAGFAKPSSQGVPACLSEDNGVAPVAAIMNRQITT